MFLIPFALLISFHISYSTKCYDKTKIIDFSKSIKINETEFELSPCIWNEINQKWKSQILKQYFFIESKEFNKNILRTLGLDAADADLLFSDFLSIFMIKRNIKDFKKFLIGFVDFVEGHKLNILSKIIDEKENILENFKSKDNKMNEWLNGYILHLSSMTIKEIIGQHQSFKHCPQYANLKLVIKELIEITKEKSDPKLTNYLKILLVDLAELLSIIIKSKLKIIQN